MKSDEVMVTKPRYNKDTELSELMEGVIDRPTGFESTKPVPGEIVQLDFPEYIPVEPESPEVKRRYAIVTPLILLMEKWAENEVDLQYRPKGNLEWKHISGDPQWNFGDMEYQTIPKSNTGNEVGITKAQRDLELITKANLHVNEALELYENHDKDNPINVMIQEQLMMAFTCINNAYGLAQKMVKQEKEMGHKTRKLKPESKIKLLRGEIEAYKSFLAETHPLDFGEGDREEIQARIEELEEELKSLEAINEN
ncbi:hypothetical protein MASR1M107_05430 [Ignavibacteriales bacterium]